MKVLIVNHSDVIGGAARAAYRLHKALLKEGVNSYMLVQNKASSDPTVISLYDTKIEKFFYLMKPTLDQLPVKFYKNRIKTLFSPSWIPSRKVIEKIKEINPDIVHLHWVCGGMLRIEDIAKINKPIVWTMHDNWLFTGGCHIMWGCENYKDKCGKCLILNSNLSYDLSRWVWYRKSKTFKKLKNIIIVGLSKWITKKAKESSLLKDKKIITLPNPIDTDIFKPIDKMLARKILNLSLSKKLIGMGSAYIDPNKGYDLLIESLKFLKKEIVLVLFGKYDEKLIKTIKESKINVMHLGTFSDDISLAILYSSLDVFIIPSRQETLSNSIMESLACGTPVVAFNIGGNPDMIEHKKNGYLAKPFDVKDLAKGIKWVLEDENYDNLCKFAREIILERFDSKKVAKRYIELYKELLKND